MVGERKTNTDGPPKPIRRADRDRGNAYASSSFTPPGEPARYRAVPINQSFAGKIGCFGIDYENASKPAQIRSVLARKAFIRWPPPTCRKGTTSRPSLRLGGRTPEAGRGTRKGRTKQGAPQIHTVRCNLVVRQRQGNRFRCAEISCVVQRFSRFIPGFDESKHVWPLHQNPDIWFYCIGLRCCHQNAR